MCSQGQANEFTPNCPVLWPWLHLLSPFDVRIVGADASAIKDVSTEHGGMALGEIGDCNDLNPLSTPVDMQEVLAR